MAKDPLDKTRDFVEEKIDQTREFLGDSYKKTRDRVEDALGDARKNWKGVSSRLDDQWDDFAGDVRKYVKANPGVSLAIAAGIGFLLGLLIRRACAIAAALLLVLQRRLRTWLSAVSASIIGIALRALSEVFREETV
jgi:ElaB/YqjD/DUF883 family membrane-anchored ribosome-binding protein